MAKRRLPSFFLTRTIFADQGEWEGRHTPLVIISSSCRSISSSHFGGTRLALSLIGVASPVSILCSHILVQPGFFGSTANKSLFSSKSLASSLYSCFSNSGAISKSSLPAHKLATVLSASRFAL